LLPQTFEGALCPMGCGDKIDVWGDHLVCCRRNKQWERHFGIQDYLGRCLRSHCLPHRLEEQVDPSADTNLRTDVTLCRWNGVADVALDIAVCHPCPLSLDPATPEACRKVLENRSTRKNTKYLAKCAAKGQEFRPFVLSTWGQFGPGSGTMGQELVRRLASARAGTFREEQVASLHQGLSLALMKGVGKQLAAMGLSREQDPLDLFGNERLQTRKRTRNALQRMVDDILSDPLSPSSLDAPQNAPQNPRRAFGPHAPQGGQPGPGGPPVLPGDGMDAWVAARGQLDNNRQPLGYHHSPSY
jgi:hypothetical protein